jgi:hypothetical protein
VKPTKSATSSSKTKPDIEFVVKLCYGWQSKFKESGYPPSCGQGRHGPCTGCFRDVSLRFSDLRPEL